MPNKSSLAPIVVSVYNRFEHFKRCIESLQKNTLSKDSDLIILSDAPSVDAHKEIINQIRSFVKTIVGFNRVVSIFRDENIGAHRSITEGLLEVLKDYDSFIFLEDDIVVSGDFLQYLNDGLQYYKDTPEIFAICGYKIPFNLPVKYNNDIYFYPSNSPWGFATWKDRWEAVNLDYFDRYSELKKDKKKYKAFFSIGFYIKGILQSDSRKEIVAGDLRVYYHMFQNNMCSVFPSISKTQNWGFDGTGEHCGNGDYDWAKPVLDTQNKPTKFDHFISYNQEILKKHRLFQERINGGILAKYLKYTWVHKLYKKLKRKH